MRRSTDGRPSASAILRPLTRRATTVTAVTFVAAAAFVAARTPALAEPGPQARAEIEHLLTFILESPCRFVRNGRDYDAERAHRHVIRKFEYFEDEIVTAEDFIELSATRSTMTGRPYQFVCDGVSRESADVLLEALERLRASSR